MQGMAAERQGGLVIGRTSTGTALARAICSSKLGPVRRACGWAGRWWPGASPTSLSPVRPARIAAVGLAWWMRPSDQTQCTQMKRRDVFTQVVDRAERMRHGNILHLIREDRETCCRQLIQLSCARKPHAICVVIIDEAHRGIPDERGVRYWEMRAYCVECGRRGKHLDTLHPCFLRLGPACCGRWRKMQWK